MVSPRMPKVLGSVPRRYPARYAVPPRSPGTDPNSRHRPEKENILWR